MNKLFKSKNIKIIIAACVIVLLAIAAAIAIDNTKINEVMNNPLNYLQGKEKIKIDCFGDSITYGTDSYIYLGRHKTYPEELEKRLFDYFSEDKRFSYIKSIEVNNLGIPGDCISKNSYKRLSKDADIVIILYGVNNIFQNRPYQGIIESNIKEIKKTGAKVFLVLYSECQSCQHIDDIKTINDNIRKVAKETGEDLIDPNIELSKIKNLDDFFIEDGVHFTSDGYELFGKIIADCIYKNYIK